MDAYIVESLTVRTECPHAHLVRRGILGKVVVDEDDVDLRQAIGIGSPGDELTVYGLDQQVATLIAVGGVTFPVWAMMNSTNCAQWDAKNRKALSSEKMLPLTATIVPAF